MTVLIPKHALRTLLIASTIVICPFFQTKSFSEDLKSVVWVTGETFRQELEKPFSANWSREQLGQMLAQVSTGRRISILLDRRLDSSAEFPLNVTNVTLLSGLTSIANMANGDVSVPDNIVYLGPNSATSRLRTLIELRSIELQSKELGIPDRRRVELQRHRTFEWHDLDSPHEILDKISTESRLRISNAGIIPHDLWAAAIMPNVKVVEALSTILIQFDFTFRWIESGASIELIPIPKSVSLQRRHRPKQDVANAISLIHQRFPALDAEVSNVDIVVNGSVEDHEAVSRLLRGEGSPRPLKGDSLLPVSQRLFTFNANQRVPIIVVMKKLEQSDIRFEYDVDEFKAAGIDLEQTIQLDAKNMRANDFFNSIFGSAHVEFQFDRSNVKLKPKKTEPSKQ